ncbi:hypothetical protein MLD38_007367 [Melastoma candidum]|uniref:Uncharacterized protein n=1 Tax=Melastoma candidum TaxID=119954 RepID=A0ACB9RQV2_9MYRT|nr:hypothetical protein MLD38_007367 [Melastoma candidum]
MPRARASSFRARPAKLSLDAMSLTVTEEDASDDTLGNEKFDWYSQWYTGQQYETASDGKGDVMVFICIPVIPGRRRLIWAFATYFAAWINSVVPRWICHTRQDNLVLDSHLCLLHRQVVASCFVKQMLLLLAFRRWLNNNASGRVDWRGKYEGDLGLLPSPLSHVVNCRSCSSAYKCLNALKVTLQVLSFASVAILTATKQNSMSALAMFSLFAAAMLSFGGSKWLAHFMYRPFHYHGYEHTFH